MVKKTVNTKKFSKRLAQLMLQHNETTYSIAEKLGLSSGTISRYTSGKISPKITTVESLSRLFNVPELWLLGYDIPKSEQENANNQNRVKNKKMKHLFNKLDEILNNFTQDDVDTFLEDIEDYINFKSNQVREKEKK